MSSYVIMNSLKEKKSRINETKLVVYYYCVDGDIVINWPKFSPNSIHGKDTRWIYFKRASLGIASFSFSIGSFCISA